MPSSADASDSKTLKRPQNPAQIYGSLFYQPPEDPPDERPREGKVSLVFLCITTILAVIGAILYLRESGVEVGPMIQSLLPERQSNNERVNNGQVTERPQPEAAITARVAASRLYLREGPGANYAPTYLLPYNWPLTILGDSQVGSDGEVWIKVRLQTEQGQREGWVSRKYVQSVTR